MLITAHSIVHLFPLPDNLQGRQSRTGRLISQRSTVIRARHTTTHHTVRWKSQFYICCCNRAAPSGGRKTTNDPNTHIVAAVPCMQAWKSHRFALQRLIIQPELRNLKKAVPRLCINVPYRPPTPPLSSPSLIVNTRRTDSIKLRQFIALTAAVRRWWNATVHTASRSRGFWSYLDRHNSGSFQPVASPFIVTAVAAAGRSQQVLAWSWSRWPPLIRLPIQQSAFAGSWSIF